MDKSSWMNIVHRLREQTVPLLRHVLGRLNSDQSLVAAGMLTYATLLSLVPLMSVAVSIVAALPGAEGLSEQLQQFLFDNFVPAARETIEQKLNELTVNAKGVTAAMGVFLIVTSLILMHNIETTINRIFGVKSTRPLIGRFMVYWSALSLGPILLGASLALSSYFFSLKIFAGVQTSFSVLFHIGNALVPFFISMLGFLFRFVAVPNRPIRRSHAVVGAVVTAILFETAKKGFGLYISSFDGYTRLYGALAAIPIFLVWIYLSWSVILFGASFTAALGSFREHREAVRWPQREMFVLCLRLVDHFHDAQRRGHVISELELTDLEPEASSAQICHLLESLRKQSIVRRDEEGSWMLTRDLRELTVGDLYQVDSFVWPDAESELMRESKRGEVWTKVFGQASPVHEDILSRPLSHCLRKDKGKQPVHDADTGVAPDRHEVTSSRPKNKELQTS